MTSLRHFIDISDHEAPLLRALIDGAAERKAARQGLPRGTVDGDRPLDGRLIALIFERPSTRTRVSFDVAMRQLGGETICLSSTELQIGRGETIADTARVLSRYVDAIMIRSTSHAKVVELVEHAQVPIINGLTDRSHPCQIMGDILTFEEHRGPIGGRTIAWSGDGNNNVCMSWIHAAARFGFTFRIACPAEYAPEPAILAWAKAAGADFLVTQDAREAVRGADCVMTDTWVSMGDGDGEARLKALEPYQVTAGLMAQAARGAVFMHCLPAYRDREVTADVIDGPQSIVFDQAENRVHAQKSILLWSLS